MSELKKPADKALREQLEAIARKHLWIETLEPRHSDRLDFHEVGVGGLVDALEAAYRAGQKAACRHRGPTKPMPSMAARVDTTT